jgi:hypothetical protein
LSTAQAARLSRVVDARDPLRSRRIEIIGHLQNLTEQVLLFECRRALDQIHALE